jgi:hypothetical protein
MRFSSGSYSKTGAFEQLYYKDGNMVKMGK